MQYQEENNYPKALGFSTGVFILMLAIAWFLRFGMPFTPEEVGTGGLVVNYGTVDEGMGDDYMSVDEPSVSPTANNALPDNVETTPSETPSSPTSDKAVVTQDAEDAPQVSASKKPSVAAPATTKETKESKPQVNQNALYKGKKNDGTGKGDGTGSTPGNQGSKEGDPLSNNYGEGGSGFGGVNLDLKSRRFVSLPRIQDDGQQSGKVAVEIRVDKTGEVVFARAGVKGSTILDRSLLDKCERAVLGARLNQLESAPDVQIGVVVFNFKVR